MHWEGISEFVYVAEHESFTQGAKALGISTAQVSRHLAHRVHRGNADKRSDLLR